MKKADNILGRVVIGFAAVCLSGAIGALSVQAAPGIPQGFDSEGEKIYNRYNETPLAAMTGNDGKRNLNSYYELRQYPGSPPMIPHNISPTFADDTANCLACHERGGYNADLDAYAPVTPHPENESCRQCHVPVKDEKPFAKNNNWQSINPPKLGQSELAGSPPSIPHSLQLREDCIACHTGPGAMAEIRVEHGSRGNCRQCHASMIATEPAKVFKRK
jgi:cytochrome c-type protein NapB